MDLFFRTMERLTPRLRAGDLDGCVSAAVEALDALPPTPFHVADVLDFTDDPADAAEHFDHFVRAESKRFRVAAVYTEMNGFDINPGRWFCDLFAYAADRGLDDLDWLSDWQSDFFPEYTLHGLESLQAVYASQAFRDPANQDACYLSSLVVLTKFQRFMQRAAGHMTSLRVPLYVTAHDYNFMARLPTGDRT